MNCPVNLKQALTSFERLQASSDTPKRDVELLLLHVLQKERSYLYSHADIQLEVQQYALFQALLQRRLQGEPIAYIVGSTDFWTVQLQVSPATLIPRPETELLVEWALTELPQHSIRLADLGTGTGAIALALANERPDWSICATELQPQALQCARDNAERLGLQQVEFLSGSWCEPLSGSFDVIISNPPYIDPQHACLQEGDVRFEPLSALVAEAQGMADIITIVEQARHYLRPGGWLVFEHGYDQAQPVQQVLTHWQYHDVFTQRDYNGQDRMTGARYGTSTASTLKG